MASSLDRLESLLVHHEFPARAICLAERMDPKGFPAEGELSARPWTYRVGSGVAVLYRYGVVVLFAVESDAADRWIANLTPALIRPYSRQEAESLSIRVEPDAKDAFDRGVLVLRDTSLDRLQVVASALSKTVALAQYEFEVAENFDRIEPFAARLEQHGSGGRSTRELLRHIGGTLLDEYKIVARVEVTDKPELTWDRPDLEQLYLRLADEFELRERDAALDRKLDLISRTAHTVLELLENRRSLRVEWYIVALIVVEIVLSVYDMFLRNP